MKPRDRLLSLQVFVTWSVKLLPVSSLQFLLSVVQKQSYCRWCPQVLSRLLCRDSFSWHSTVIDYVPEAPDNFAIYSDDEDIVSSNSEKQQPSASRDSDCLLSTDSSSHNITEGELNDLIRDFELLASRLRQWDSLHHSVKVTTFRTRNQELEQFLKTVGYFTYCKDIDGLIDAMRMRHSPEQWRLFIDASKASLKAVLLHNGNKLPSIPVAYAPSTKETFTTMNSILVEVDCKNYKWEFCGDFKVIAVLLGLKAGYTKYSCFLCEWDSHARGTHCSRKHWPHRQSPAMKMLNISLR